MYHPLSLQELNQKLIQGRIQNHSIVITFDDGYADNLYQAKPILEQYHIPATVFVTTGFIAPPNHIWWDDIEWLFLQPGKLPGKLSLDINGSSHSWDLEASAQYSEAKYRKYRHWDILMNENPTPRHRIYRDLCQLLRPLLPEKRQEVLQELFAWAGKKERNEASNRTLSAKEVKQLADGGFVEVGAHCRTHPVLATLSKEHQQEEIQQSKRELELLLGQPVMSFAYPYGTRSDYTRETVMIVQKTDFTCACSNFADVVFRGTDRFQLPRYAIRNWSGKTFAHRLQEWFYG